MIFASVPIDTAAGAVLAHGIAGQGFSLSKGRTLSREDLSLLAGAGHRTVVVARLEPSDVPEDEAAATIARSLAGDGVSVAPAATGRANLHAGAAGLAVIDAARVHRMNALDEAITIATVPEFAVLKPEQMLATIKIIPFSAPASAVSECLVIAAEGPPVLRLARLRPHQAGLVQTTLPGTKASVLDKTVAGTRARLAALGSELARWVIVDHQQAAVAAAVRRQREEGLDPILLMGASATADRRDVIPTAIVALGGEIVHFGMPVDPGNLLLLARLGEARIVGLPGCARSPKLNGFDWVLQRLLAQLDIGPADIMRMGVGGLLMDIPSRPAPRELRTPDPPATIQALPAIGGVVLAAGLGTRMGQPDKLLLEVNGRPLVVASVEAAIGAGLRPVIVVVGHRSEKLREALAGRSVTIVENPKYREGVSTSIRTGVAALPAGVDGAVFLLADMPRLRATHIDRLVAAFVEAGRHAICVPTRAGKRGNPVLWGVDYLPDLLALAGDVGGRALLGRYADRVREVEMPDDAVLIDIDQPGDLAALLADPADPALDPGPHTDVQGQIGG